MLTSRQQQLTNSPGRNLEIEAADWKCQVVNRAQFLGIESWKICRHAPQYQQTCAERYFLSMQFNIFTLILLD